MIGYAICASFCTHNKSLNELKALTEKYDIIPILSYNAANTDTRFGKGAELRTEVKKLCGRDPVENIVEAEKLGPATPLECLVICPCTGNTLSKIANGITDTAVTMAAKAHLRSGGRLIIALATNDAMSANLKNISTLLNRKNVYFVPMVQDDPIMKPHSLVADFSLIEKCIAASQEGRQIRPLFI